MIWVLAFLAGTLFGSGVYLILQRDGIKLVLGLSFLLGAANLFLLTCSTFFGERAPYTSAGAEAGDPVPQALILTAIAIGFGTTALLVILLLSLQRRFSSLDVDEVSSLEH